jgi:flagellar hook-associated protein 2
MPLINFSGIASGIDTEGLIKATSDATRSTRVKPSEKKISELSESNDALDKLKSLLKTLQTNVNTFSSVGTGLLQKRASSADETVVTAASSSQASNGSYDLTVTQMARGHTISIASTTTYTSSSATISGGAPDFTETMTFTVGSATVEVPIDQTTTLSGFVTAFNGATSNAVASVVNVGTSASPDYRILIKSNKTGTADGQISINAGDLATLAARVPPAFDQRTEVAAQNAQFTISGISGTITRGTNAVADLIPGVTFNLKATGGPTAITVSDDTTATTAKVQEFIDAYNEVVAFIQENNQVVRQEDGENVTNTFSPLSLTQVDDNALQSIRGEISQSAYYNTGESSTATNEIRIFAELGITTDSDPYNSTTGTGGGSLKFDSTVFSSAVSKEPDSVRQIMQNFADAVGRQTGVIQQYIGFNLILDNSINSNKDQISDLNDRIAQAEAAILATEASMRQRFARLESTIGRLQNQQNALTSALAGLGN